jgi:hypothetical protein
MSELMEKYDEEFIVSIGRATEGRTFIEVVHVPTKKSRFIEGLGGDNSRDVTNRFKMEIIKELGLK